MPNQATRTSTVRERIYAGVCLRCGADRYKVITERIHAVSDNFVLGEKGYYVCQCGVAPFAYGASQGDAQGCLKF